MKVIEIRNLCLSYDKRICEQGPANWAGLYVMKQILRGIQLKQLKSAINETELWVPENIVRGVDKMFGKKKNDKKDDSKKSGKKARS